jgi:hypothetical protein
MNRTIRTLYTVLTRPALTRVLAACITAYCALMACVVGAQPASTGSGQAYPNKPIRIIVPSGAGSPGDYWARQIAAKFPEVFGQNLIVDNRPGGNGFRLGSVTGRNSMEAFNAMVRADRARTGKLLADAGITPE